MFDLHSKVILTQSTFAIIVPAQGTDQAEGERSVSVFAKIRRVRYRCNNAIPIVVIGR
jgi:hypothetical protein